MVLASSRWIQISTVAAALASGACSAGSGSSNGLGQGAGGSGTGASGGIGGSGGDGGTINVGAGGSATGVGGPGSVDCDVETTFIYVVDFTYALHRFDPATGNVQRVGQLACPAPVGTYPFSMAVARNGIAWVLYSDGNLYHVSIHDASCTTSGFVPNQQGLGVFGMAFVSDAPGSAAESLYLAQSNPTTKQGQYLARIDTTSLAVSIVGQYDALFAAAELTGNGNGELFGFFATQPNVVAQINKASGSIMSQNVPQVNIGNAWAFAFWGGGFYLFSAQGFNSKVDRYDVSSGQTATVVPDIGFMVVGAGVSTCAPVGVPK